MILICIFGVFLIIRICQRMYYFMKGHILSKSTESPIVEIDYFLEMNSINNTCHSCQSNDDIKINYRKVGHGKKIILLANGVGTNFFMWLPLLRWLILFRPKIFDEITLVVLSYRGLFETDPKLLDTEVKITMLNCVEDIRKIMEVEHIPTFHTVIGWSTGAQVMLLGNKLYPEMFQRLFIMNPSNGNTLHSTLQPIIQFPTLIQHYLSQMLTQLVKTLKKLINNPLWDQLKVIALSIYFRIFLELLAFFGGYPPDQPVYFHEYMRDTFRTRAQTRGLLSLILALDCPLPEGSLSLTKPTVIISGYPDFITGVYQSYEIVKQSSLVNKSLLRHVCFRMGSHFILIEWPDIVAQELINLIEYQQ